ncbi:hypothetical protein [Arenimonas alkanexedens]
MLLNRGQLLPLLVLLALTAAIFWPGLSGDFVFDDYPNIVTNPAVHLESLDRESLAGAARGYEHGPFGRPIATLTFGLNHYLGGNDAWGFKFFNLILHLLNVGLVLMLGQRLLKLAGVDASSSANASLAIAAIWALHPLQVSTVMYVVQRMEMMSLTFTLLALIAYLRGREAQLVGRAGWPWLLACLPLMLLSLLCKETGVLLPVYTLAIELTVLQFAADRTGLSARLKVVYALSFVIAMSYVLFWVLPAYLDPAIYEFRGFTLMDRLLTQPRVLVMYLAQMMFPAPGLMTFYYDTFDASRGLLSPPTTLLCILLLAALAAAGIWLRRRAPLFALGVFLFFGSHLLTSSFFPLELAFEHRNYFSLFAMLLSATDLVLRMPHGEIPRMRIYTIGIVVAGLCLLTLLRAATWGNPTNLAMDLAAKNPNSSRASVDLGEQFMKLANADATSPFYLRAEREFERGAAMANSSPLPEQALILLASSAQIPAKDAWWQSFIQKIATRPIGPQELMSVTGMLQQRDKLNQFNDARFRELMDTLVAREPLPPYMLATYGDYLLVHHDNDAAARTQFMAALAAGNDDEEHRALVVRMVTNLFSEGHVDLARDLLTRAGELGIQTPLGIMISAPAPTDQPDEAH